MKLWKWLLTLAVVGYVISPVDLIPDVLPVIGWLDDIGALGLVATALLASFRRERRRKAEQNLVAPKALPQPGPKGTP